SRTSFPAYLSSSRLCLSYAVSRLSSPPLLVPFFYSAPPTTVIYALSLHDALPILIETVGVGQSELDVAQATDTVLVVLTPESGRSEEHTSELVTSASRMPSSA